MITLVYGLITGICIGTLVDAYREIHGYRSVKVWHILAYYFLVFYVSRFFIAPALL